MKEDEVDRDKRRESAETQKSTLDLKKKNEKKKNLERQALETRRAKSRQRGSPRKSSLMRTRSATVTTAATTPRGWRPCLTVSSRVRLEPTSTPHGREHQRRGQAALLRGNRGSRPLATPVLMPLPCLCGVSPSRAPSLPQRQRRAIGLTPGDGAVDPWPCCGFRQWGNKPQER